MQGYHPNRQRKINRKIQNGQCKCRVSESDENSPLPLVQAESGQFLNNCVLRQATMKAPMCPHALWSTNLAFAAANKHIQMQNRSNISAISYKWNGISWALPCSLQVLRASSTTGIQTLFGPSACFANSDATIGWNTRSFMIPVSFRMHSVTHCNWDKSFLFLKCQLCCETNQFNEIVILGSL